MTPLIHACLAVAAGVCVNDDAKIEIVRTTIWSGARIAVHDALVTSAVATDSLVTADRRQMQRACGGWRCLSYHKHCETKDDQYVCRIYYVYPSDTYLKDISIEGADKAAVDAVLPNLGLALEDGKGPFAPLAGLRESPDAKLPVCHDKPRGRDAEAWRKSLERRGVVWCR
jgi:hypothetical protein